jgi:hypothetical protein
MCQQSSVTEHQTIYSGYCIPVICVISFLLYISLKLFKPTAFLHLTVKNRASYIQDGRTATLQMLHFIFIFFNKYKY